MQERTPITKHACGTGFHFRNIIRLTSTVLAMGSSAIGVVNSSSIMIAVKHATSKHSH